MAVDFLAAGQWSGGRRRTLTACKLALPDPLAAGQSLSGNAGVAHQPTCVLLPSPRQAGPAPCSQAVCATGTLPALHRSARTPCTTHLCPRPLRRSALLAHLLTRCPRPPACPPPHALPTPPCPRPPAHLHGLPLAHHPREHSPKGQEALRVGVCWPWLAGQPGRGEAMEGTAQVGGWGWGVVGVGGGGLSGRSAPSCCPHPHADSLPAAACRVTPSSSQPGRVVAITGTVQGWNVAAALAKPCPPCTSPPTQTPIGPPPPPPPLFLSPHPTWGERQQARPPFSRCI